MQRIDLIWIWKSLLETNTSTPADTRRNNNVIIMSKELCDIFLSL